MANPFYQPGKARARKVNDLFGLIAHRYDRINDVQSFGLHRLWKARLAVLADLGPDTHGLDVCCGTGDIAFRLAARGARVTGVDYSQPMLDVARRRLTRHRSNPSSSRVEFLRGDALEIPFPANTFHAVTIGYGLRNLSDFQAGLWEMWRVARVGGRLLVLDFGKPDHPLWRRFYFGYLRRAVPLLGRLLVGRPDAYAYILESLTHYPGQRGIEALMRGMPLTDVRVEQFLGGAMSINYGVKKTEAK